MISSAGVLHCQGPIPRFSIRKFIEVNKYHIFYFIINMAGLDLLPFYYVDKPALHYIVFNIFIQ